MKVPKSLIGKPKHKLSITDYVYLCLRKGNYMTFWELQAMIKQNTGKFFGEPSISAAIRDLRNEGPRSKYELHPYKEVVEKRRRKGGKAYEYKLMEVSENGGV